LLKKAKINKMASNKIELEVDFIGGEGALTAAEEKALSDFFQQRKKAKRLVQKPKSRESRASVRQEEVFA
jgi:hypothetical protein